MSKKEIGIAEANRQYQPGDIIIRLDRPLVHVTKYEHRLFVCDWCMVAAEKSTIVCQKCLKVYYCSRECQDRAWEEQIIGSHRIECAILSRRKPMDFENNGFDYMQRLTLRLYLLVTTDINPSIRERPFHLHNNQTRTFDDMEYHPEMLKDSPQFDGILKYFQFYNITEFDQDLLLRCYGILHVNSFGIDCYNVKSLTIEHRGTGLYPEASVFDHSCVPNACASGDGLVLEIRALSPIKPGQSILIDYLQDILPWSERIDSLSQRYFFTCQCSFGCDPALQQSLSNSEKRTFDSNVDYKRFKVLCNLIETITQSNRTQINRNQAQQLFKLMLQRLQIQEEYYRAAQHHPCLSLFYQEFLRFLLLNHHHLTGVEQQLHRITLLTKKNLSVTHGIEHPFYRYNAIQNFNENTPTS